MKQRTKEIGDRAIGLVGSNGKAHQVIVPEGMMNDIVKPLWGSPLIVKGVK